MHLISEIRHWLSPDTLVTIGYWAIGLIIFAESGLFLGFFLPGDSLLIIAGVAAAAHKLNLAELAILVFFAAFLGDQFGYWLGHTFGRRLFARKDSLLFKKEYVAHSEAFFAKHGPKAVIFARFVPVVRSFTPALAGIGSMRYRIYWIYDIIGAFLWGVGVIMAGYLLGRQIHNLDKYINYIVIVIIIVSFIPVIGHILNTRSPKAKP